MNIFCCRDHVLLFAAQTLCYLSSFCLVFVSRKSAESPEALPRTYGPSRELQEDLHKFSACLKATYVSGMGEKDSCI